MISWYDFVTISSFIVQSTMFSAIFFVAKVKSNIDCDISKWNVYVISSEILINSQLNRLIHDINAFAWIEFWIFEFHHEWCALKFSQINAFLKLSKRINLCSIVYFLLFSWLFSFYILKTMKFLTFNKISSILMFESFDISYFEIQFIFIFKFFEMNVIMRDLKFV